MTQEALSVSEEGLNVPGARASSDSTANAANQSATSNLPNIFKSETAMASTQVPSVVNVSSGASAAAGSTGAVNPVSTGLSSAEDGSEAAASEGSTPKPDPSAPAEESATKDDEASTNDKSKRDKSKDDTSKATESSADSEDSDDISGSV
ncbi:MAG: hypothetical protein L0G36_05010, partial [Brevibacterium sp.]|nr:hypothetical protein [Brevibacterium sp.]